MEMSKEENKKLSGSQYTNIRLDTPDISKDFSNSTKKLEDIIVHIVKARTEAFKEGIRANTIIIDEELAKVNGCFQNYELKRENGESIKNSVKIPPMISGLVVKYEKNLTEALGFNFMVYEDEYYNPLENFSTEELEHEIEARKFREALGTTFEVLEDE